MSKRACTSLAPGETRLDPQPGRWVPRGPLRFGNVLATGVPAWPDLRFDDAEDRWWVTALRLDAGACALPLTCVWPVAAAIIPLPTALPCPLDLQTRLPALPQLGAITVAVVVSDRNARSRRHALAVPHPTVPQAARPGS